MAGSLRPPANFAKPLTTLEQGRFEEPVFVVESVLDKK
jgi:hypothetical protein